MGQFEIKHRYTGTVIYTVGGLIETHAEAWAPAEHPQEASA